MNSQKVSLKGTTKISLNDRFSAYRKEPASVASIRQRMQMARQASARNRRLAQQMENRPSVIAALKLKKRSLMQRLGQTNRENVKTRLSLGFRTANHGFRSNSFPIGGRGGRLTQPRGVLKQRYPQRKVRGSPANYGGRGSMRGAAMVQRLGGSMASSRGNRRGGIRGRRNFRQRGNLGRPFQGNNFRSPQRGRGRSPQRGRFNSRRGRGGSRGRGGRGGGSVPTKEQLDNQLDEYMAKTKSHLDAELDAYMSQAD